MAEPISESNRSVSPLPINKVIVINGIPTQPFIRYLQDLRNSSKIDTNTINQIIKEVQDLYYGTTIEDTSSSVTLDATSQTLLVDASDSDINISMPNPAECLNSNRSYQIAIAKKDTSLNKVNILPFDAELIVGEANQILNSEGDVINLVTDGINWYLGA